MGKQPVEDVGYRQNQTKKSWIRFRASRIAIWATNFGGNSGIMSNPMKTREKVVGAKGFEPSTSWSRTRRASQAALRPDNPQRQTNIAARNSRISQQSSIAYRPVSCYVHRALSIVGRL